ncbi:tail fiber domain-containing protein [Rhizobium sp. rho-13.1]|nr:tail fiber domain-containing protein [Rhizobium sp. rho-13.1]TQY14255.1 tail fiber domain-containing protein [Rhizobium sp. rho-1.1]
MDSLYSAGAPLPYQGSTVIDQSDATKSAQQSVLNTAADGSPLIKNGQNAVNNVTTGAAFTPTAGNTLTRGTNYTNGGIANSQSLYSTLSGSTNPGQTSLQGTANGDYLNSNPYLQSAIKSANQPLIDQYTQQVAPGIDSQFAAGGRTGSGAYAATRNTADTTFTKALTDQTANIMNTNYANERQNQVAAGTSIGNLYNANAQNALTAAGQVTSGNQAQQDSRNAAASALSGVQNAQAQTQLTGAGMTGQQRANDYYDASQVAGVGAAQDTYADLLKQAEISKWDTAQQQPINNIANEISLLNNGGYNAQTTTKPVYSNGLSTGIGALGSIASIFGMLCDTRAKNIIRESGWMLNGTRLYEFTYKNDPTGTVYEGPMAQEVEITRPYAVREIDGFKRISNDALIGGPAYV